MEGLIKGLVDVALGGGRDRDGRDEDDQSPDVQSRSSWAEVVSGDPGDTDDQETHRPNYSSQWKKQHKQEQDQRGREDWEVAGSTAPRRPLKSMIVFSSISEIQSVCEGYENDEGGKRHDNNQNNWSREVQKDQWHGYKKPPSEQEYSDEVEIGGSWEPSEGELADLSQACNRLWELDLNRLVPGKDYEIDCGEGKKIYQKEDMAQGSLFSWLNEDIFRKPTYSRFCSLLDNYNPNSGSKEVVTSEEKQEQVAFIEEISRTAPIKYLHQYLSSKGIVSGNNQDFKRMMTSLWFDLYGRGGTAGSSSAFEHVFVGEIKQHGEQEISGFHNWLQPDSETQLLTVQFEWNGILKSVSSTLVGVSPEFEIALYTLCFFMGREDNHIQLGPYPVNIKCYRFGEKIGSVFPIAES
ncbi:hypothetical protein EZV62_023789 [Acer yangbiense]|uniref:EndoU domain-containing protein n=1 Tax=Acer yangbiense TaxID=1000413 RepID=A0A5C7H3I2_9ROSI|nr:hypothetical protein EZV62_023789 [Acer yangbiense]